MEKQGFDSWAIVELMGHARIAGKVTEAEIGGGKLLRIDVPEINGKQPITKYFGNAAVYAITPVDEETARMAATQCDAAPVNEWSARGLIERADAAKSLPSETKAVRTVPGYEPDDDQAEEEEDGLQF
ncbi:MAG TPA: hypothetical protein VIM67_10585 [Terriglobus sp.]